MIKDYIDEQGNFDKQGFQHSIQQGILNIVQETLMNDGKENQAPSEATIAIKDQEQSCLDPEYEPSQNDEVDEDSSETEDQSPIEEAMSSFDMAVDILQERIQNSTQEEERQSLRMKISDCQNLISECMNYEGNFQESLETLEESALTLGNSLDEKIQRRIAEIFFLKGNVYSYMSENDPKFMQNAY